MSNEFRVKDKNSTECRVQSKNRDGVLEGVPFLIREVRKKVPGARENCKLGQVAANGGVGGIGAEVRGGKQGSGCYFANFAPQKAAGDTGAATIVTQTRRQ